MSRALDLSNAFGYLHRQEVLSLQDIALAIPKGGICVNIGAGTGTSSMAVLEVRPDLAPTFYTIDISPGGPLGGLLNEVNAFKDTAIRLPNQILGDSKVIGANWSLKIDYLFIDGDHSKAGIEGDIEAWYKHLKNDAIIIFHDYDSKNWPDVKVAVDTYMIHHDLLGLVDTLIAFRVNRE